MSLIGLVVTLIVVGVLLWLVNTYGGAYIDHKILTIINVVLWLLNVFGLLPLASVPVPRWRS